MESYGRFGEAARDTLHVLSQAAGVFLGDALAPARLEPLWRAKCQAAVCFAVADIALLCLGHSISASECSIHAGSFMRAVAAAVRT